MLKRAIGLKKDEYFIDRKHVTKTEVRCPCRYPQHRPYPDPDPHLSPSAGGEPVRERGLTTDTKWPTDSALVAADGAAGEIERLKQLQDERVSKARACGECASTVRQAISKSSTEDRPPLPRVR